MNLRIVKTLPRSGGFKEFFLAILLHPLAVNLILMFSVLLVTETSYRNYYNQAKHVLYWGGIGSVIGAIVLFQAILKTKRRFSRYSHDCSADVEQGGRFYLLLTDDFIEKGVEHSWSQRFYWQLLQGYTENRVGFVIRMGLNDLTIPFYDLDNQENISSLGEFLKSKSS
jgi:hypothetical protein